MGGGAESGKELECSREKGWESGLFVDFVFSADDHETEVYHLLCRVYANMMRRFSVMGTSLTVVNMGCSKKMLKKAFTTKNYLQPTIFMVIWKYIYSGENYLAKWVWKLAQYRSN